MDSSSTVESVPIPERHRFFEELIRRFEGLPWVEAATVAEYAPLSGHPTQELMPQTGEDPVTVTVARVWTGYFEVMEMEILRGRAFLGTDTVDAPGVVVVNESLATRLAADGDVIGHTLTWPGGGEEPDRSLEVVGVVRDAKQVTLLDDPAQGTRTRPRYFFLRPELSVGRRQRTGLPMAFPSLRPPPGGRCEELTAAVPQGPRFRRDS